MDRNRQGREYHYRLNANSPGPRLWPDANLRQCRLRAVAKGIADMGSRADPQRLDL